MKEVQLLIGTIEKEGLWEKELEIGRNEYLKVKGSIDTNLYFIEGGSLRIYVIDEYEEHTCTIFCGRRRATARLFFSVTPGLGFLLKE